MRHRIGFTQTRRNPIRREKASMPLRPAKGLLIAVQYHHKAEEGRFTGGDAK